MTAFQNQLQPHKRMLNRETTAGKSGGMGLIYVIFLPWYVRSHVLYCTVINVVPRLIHMYRV